MTDKINSDTNWGCLIRVGQMAMAAAIKKYLSFTTKLDEKTLNSMIIPAFLDSEISTSKPGQYSLNSIVKQAKSYFCMDYG